MTTDTTQTVSAEARPPGGLFGTVVAAVGGGGMGGLSFYLAWKAAPLFGINRAIALGLVLGAYIVVAATTGAVALLFNHSVDRREARARE
jgi:hypothetical protein